MLGFLCLVAIIALFINPAFAIGFLLGFGGILLIIFAFICNPVIGIILFAIWLFLMLQ